MTVPSLSQDQAVLNVHRGCLIDKRRYCHVVRLIVQCNVLAPPSQVHVDSTKPDSSETFVYVNGICTTKRMALATGAELSEMLNKNVVVVHNPTDSAILDLLEVWPAKQTFGIPRRQYKFLSLSQCRSVCVRLPCRAPRVGGCAGWSSPLHGRHRFVSL